MSQIDMVTSQGHVVKFDEPNKTTFDLEDIRTQTKNICRYNGAIVWKLVQHLALCVKLTNIYFPELSSQCRAILAGYAGVHDFHEVYVGDVVSGLKRYLSEYQKIEEAWENYTHNSIHLPLEFKDCDRVKHIDIRALVIEMHQLEHPAAPLVAKWYGGPPSSKENAIFYRVQNYTLEGSWRTITKAMRTARSKLLQTNTQYGVLYG